MNIYSIVVISADMLLHRPMLRYLFTSINTFL